MLSTLRRAVTVPMVIIVEVLLLAATPVLLAAAALVAAGTRSRRPLRSTALVLAYAVIELSALGRLLRGEDDVDALLADVLDRAYRAMRAILHVRLVVEDGSATRAQLATGNGLIVLSRHCGPGDSLFIAWLLIVQYQLRLRVVLTFLLRLEPTVDLAGDQLPLCFVGHSGRRAREQIRSLAASMSAGDALLLFPEGGNFSWPRWRRAMARLEETGAYRLARRARRRTHTLPPRLGGAMAALTGSPAADVLLLAHSGFAPDGRDRPWWQLPDHRDLLVHAVVVPAASVPRDDEALSTWLEAAWSDVDTWVAGHAAPTAVADDPAAAVTPPR